MLILSRVCAEFHNADGEPVFSVTPATRNLFVEAPETIREDPLFRMLLSDGSLEAAVSEDRKKVLENNPSEGHDATGKTIPPEPEDASGPEPAEKPARSVKTGRPKPSEAN